VQIHVSKKGRTVKLGKRETDLLNDAKALLCELAQTGGRDITTDADNAAEAIGATLEAIANQGRELVTTGGGQ
jgi:hypothetical protein